MRTVRVLASLALACATAAQEPSVEEIPQGRFQDKVDVDRVLLDLRLVDGKGAPIPGLVPADLQVRVDGVPAAVESLRWISGTTAYAEGLSPEQAFASGVEAAPAGRLLVFFFQKDMEPSRSSGLLRMKSEAVKLLATLKPEDRVAVASFDTHLRLWTDFTSDHGRLRRIIERSILFDEEPRELAASRPSLVPAYDYRAARDAASPEQGFLVLAKALAPVPGTKSLAFFGWGLGRMSGGSVSMLPEYDAARRALRDARVVVFSLDITDADSHSLEVGLQQLAEDTGGFYAKTHDFAGLAMSRLESALQGYYALAFVKPDLPRGRHDVAVELVGRKGDVLVAATYVD
jgi:VWFA-related protein